MTGRVALCVMVRRMHSRATRFRDRALLYSMRFHARQSRASKTRDKIASVTSVSKKWLLAKYRMPYCDSFADISTSG